MIVKENSGHVFCGTYRFFAVVMEECLTGENVARHIFNEHLLHLATLLQRQMGLDEHFLFANVELQENITQLWLTFSFSIISNI